MTGKEYLQQVGQWKERIDQIERLIEDIEAELETGISAVDPSKEHLNSNPGTHSPHEPLILSLETHKANLIKEKREGLDLMVTIASQIREMDNKTYSAILNRRYMYGHSWEKIAHDLNFSPSYMKNSHAKALDAFESQWL